MLGKRIAAIAMLTVGLSDNNWPPYLTKMDKKLDKTNILTKKLILSFIPASYIFRTIEFNSFYVQDQLIPSLGRKIVH